MKAVVSPSTKTARVAVITRTKDRTHLLERTLASIDAQSFEDYVHVVINDGGDKETLESALDNHPNERRHVIHNSTSVGLTKALNQAISAVDSTYIAILDDDDTWHSNKLQLVDDYVAAHPDCRAVAVPMDVVIEEIHDEEIITTGQFLHPESGEGEISLYKQSIRNYLTNGVITYQRSLYDELGGYDDTLAVGEDWDFGIRLLQRCDVAFLRGESLHFYHQRPTQKGSEGNSVHAEVAQQERTITQIRNKYLREDLSAGRFGVGYIMNRAVADQEAVVRLEGHINFATDQIQQALQTTITEVVENHSVLHKIRTKLKHND